MFFCFKQKTAYEMRISDWSSDVCSSDLLCGHGQRHGGSADAVSVVAQAGRSHRQFAWAVRLDDWSVQQFPREVRHQRQLRRFAGPGRLGCGGRSEEHTSELQSLMRNSYAVFCLKKKKKYNKNTQRTTDKTIRK